jgi:glycosyltransferase involved in cell wall biosynthesis
VAITTTIAIATYNRAAEVGLTLDGLLRLEVGRATQWEVLVIGNNCTDDTHAVVASFEPRFGGRLRYVEEPRQGLSHARNRAISEARYEVVAFLDDDVDVDPQWLGALAGAFDSGDYAGVGGRATLRYPLPGRPSWLAERNEGFLTKVELGDERRPAGPDELFGLNVSIRTDWIRRVGGFRTDLGRVGSCLIGSEETELLERIVRAGGSLLYEPLARVWHRVPPERLRRRWFWSRRFWGNRGDVRRRPAAQISLRSVARAAWHSSRAAGRTAGALLLQGPASERCFHEMNEIARWAGEFSGLVDRLVHRDAPPALAPSAPVASPAAGAMHR